MAPPLAQVLVSSYSCEKEKTTQLPTYSLGLQLPALEVQAKSPLAPRGRSLTPGLMSSATGPTRCVINTKPEASGAHESPARVWKKE